MKKTEYMLDDLPRFSPWPARLLGIEPWEQKQKNPAEITREYEYEKWGTLLKKVQDTERDVLIEEVDEWEFGQRPDSLCSVENRFILLSAAEAHRHHLDLVEKTIKPFLPASALVELGAGYGSIILALAHRIPFANIPIMAGEYTTSGIKLLNCLAQAQNLDIEVAPCDFFSSKVVDLMIPPNAVIFTSYAICSVPTLSERVVEVLCSYSSKVVIHIEPCYEHCNNGLLGLMRRRYIEVNDYNTNLVTLLHEQQDRGLIRILEEKQAVFGANPLFPLSIITWKPQS